MIITIIITDLRNLLMRLQKSRLRNNDNKLFMLVNKEFEFD